MSGGEIQTQLDRPTLPPGTADKAIAYLTRTGNADLLPVLGLDTSPPLVIDGKACCPACREPYRGDGRTTCRRRSCTLGPTSRSIAKPATDADKALAAEYEAGATIVELARRHGRSQDWVRSAVLRAGVEMRRAQPRPAPIRPRATWGGAR